MALSAVFKYTAKQAVDCRNMADWKYGTPTPLPGYSTSSSAIAEDRATP